MRITSLDVLVERQVAESPGVKADVRLIR